jgi:Na+-driven multidrug efflux pump
VLVLQQFRPSDDVGIYFAVVKTLALVSFIHYAMSASTAHRFAEYNALGDKDRLSAYVMHSIQWTFWPSLAATLVLLAFGKPLLWLFGPQFVAGYDIMFIAAMGLLVRAAIGPVERLFACSATSICACLSLSFVMNRRASRWCLYGGWRCHDHDRRPRCAVFAIVAAASAWGAGVRA